MIFARWLVSMTMATGITLGLFYFMQALIATGERFDQPATVGIIYMLKCPTLSWRLLRKSTNLN